jgi:Domain of unknown function (DUF4062)
MIVDTTAAARRADPERAREWLGEQAVFISSAMDDTAAERSRVAAAVEDEGARALWFEEFGRDADPAEAFLSEVDRSTIYVAILNELYGKLLPSGFSATETEYERARETGKRIAAYPAASAPGREGHLARFIDRIRTFIVTEDFRDAGDLERRVRRRLHELAAEALSPWVKLGELVFRADEIDDAGATVTLRARSGDEIARRLESLRDQQFGRARQRFVYLGRVGEGEVSTVRRTVRAGGANEITVELTQVRPPQVNQAGFATAGRSTEDLVELGMRALFLGEPLPEQVGMVGFAAETGIEHDDLHQAFALSNEIAPAIVRLLVAEGLVGSGRARRLVASALGPRIGNRRRIAVEWEGQGGYGQAEGARRAIEGDWVLE